LFFSEHEFYINMLILQISIPILHQKQSGYSVVLLEARLLPANRETPLAVIIIFCYEIKMQ
jgi:hypothetical protein